MLVKLTPGVGLTASWGKKFVCAPIKKTWKVARAAALIFLSRKPHYQRALGHLRLRLYRVRLGHRALLFLSKKVRFSF
jgi:hypothetical protein